MIVSSPQNVLLFYCVLYECKKLVNPVALRKAKIQWSFGHSECYMVKQERLH